MHTAIGFNVVYDYGNIALHVTLPWYWRGKNYLKGWGFRIFVFNKYVGRKK